MFYSETLLAKTGPLARVWLAANLERKLTKQNVLSSKLDENVKDIIGEGQAPMALRLSGQLLLGVVKIYSRKAKYLQDDCNDALYKIRVFRPGNVDLPNDGAQTVNPNALILPDAVTELDLFAPLPDPNDLLRGDDFSFNGPDRTLLPTNDLSQLLPGSTPSKRPRRTLELFEDDLADVLDFGDDNNPSPDEPSVEIGRREHTPRNNDPSGLDDGLGLEDMLDFGDDAGADTTMGGAVQPPADMDMPMFDIDDGYQMNDEVAAANQRAMDNAQGLAERRRRDSGSPLSELRASVERELEQTFHLDQEMQDDTIVEQQAQQRVKRRRVMKQDHETQLHNSQIKRQQEDRSAITRAPTFLPRNPVLLQLMEMQRQGTFVSSLIGEGLMRGCAPQLRGVLSLEVVMQAGERKRKRDAGIAEEPMPEVEEIADEEGLLPGLDGNNDFDPTLLHSDDAPLQPAPMFSDGLQPQQPDDDDIPYAADSPGQAFDQTEMPILHPAASGPVSLATTNAVHLLRAHFAPDHPASATEPPTPSKRTKAEALFTDLCPEDRTSRQDATKMFFELLVLGTKDAVKVEQVQDAGLGGPIRVRGKRGLWGEWAEMGAGGDIAQENDGEGVVEVAA